MYVFSPVFSRMGTSKGVAGIGPRALRLSELSFIPAEAGVPGADDLASTFLSSPDLLCKKV